MATAVALSGVAPFALAQTSDVESRLLADGEIPFKLPPLPYGYDALEPALDAETLRIHHDMHHAAYVRNLNKAIARVPQIYKDWKYADITADPDQKAQKWLLELLNNPAAVPGEIREAVRNNAGGHYNHSLFWQMMKKSGGDGPQGELAAAIDRDCGGFNAFKKDFAKAAVTLFGSGWAWLTIDSGKLRVEITANEDTPLTAGRPVLLGIDVWEHSYYLQYRNRRADYVAAWWNIVNWDFVADRFSRLKG